jgi:hypothetical protein
MATYFLLERQMSNTRIDPHRAESIQASKERFKDESHAIDASDSMSCYAAQDIATLSRARDQDALADRLIVKLCLDLY